MEDFKWFIYQSLAGAHISSCAELCKKAGIKYRTLRDRFKDPSTLRLYEFIELDKILNFSDEQILGFYQKIKSHFN